MTGFHPPKCVSVSKCCCNFSVGFTEWGPLVKHYYFLFQKGKGGNLLKGNVRPCCLICSSVSGPHSLFSTINGGEQILTSAERDERQEESCMSVIWIKEISSRSMLVLHWSSRCTAKLFSIRTTRNRGKKQRFVKVIMWPKVKKKNHIKSLQLKV